MVSLSHRLVSALALLSKGHTRPASFSTSLLCAYYYYYYLMPYTKYINNQNNVNEHKLNQCKCIESSRTLELEAKRKSHRNHKATLKHWTDQRFARPMQRSKKAEWTAWGWNTWLWLERESRTLRLRAPPPALPYAYRALWQTLHPVERTYFVNGPYIVGYFNSSWPQ